MVYHILNGDCLANQLAKTKIGGENIICSECLVEGDLSGNTLTEFWQTRANYIADTYSFCAESYYEKSVVSFEKIINLPTHAEVYLWFEDDLFCQTNMWFILSLLFETSIQRKIFRIFPIINQQADRWKGFGISSAEMLEQAYFAKIQFTDDDIKMGNQLWVAYKTNDLQKLKNLALKQSPCFQYLHEVCQAHLDRFPIDSKLGRPEKTVKEIVARGITKFPAVFDEFSQKQGVYGFGDLQVKTIYNKLFSALKSD